MRSHHRISGAMACVRARRASRRAALVGPVARDYAAPIRGGPARRRASPPSTPMHAPSVPLARSLAGALLALLALAGCASSSAASGPARPQRVAWVDYRSQVLLELVNESHTGRVEQYSQVRSRAEASRKVQTDEVMAELVRVLRELDFAERALPGPMPRSGNGTNMMGLELDDGGQVSHLLAWRGMPAEQRLAFLDMANNFAEIYNSTYSLQAVDVGLDESPFENPVGPTRTKPSAPIQKVED